MAHSFGDVVCAMQVCGHRDVASVCAGDDTRSVSGLKARQQNTSGSKDSRELTESSVERIRQRVDDRIPAENPVDAAVGVRQFGEVAPTDSTGRMSASRVVDHSGG